MHHSGSKQGRKVVVPVVLGKAKKAGKTRNAKKGRTSRRLSGSKRHEFKTSTRDDFSSDAIVVRAFKTRSIQGREKKDFHYLIEYGGIEQG